MHTQQMHWQCLEAKQFQQFDKHSDSDSYQCNETILKVLFLVQDTFEF